MEKKLKDQDTILHRSNYGFDWVGLTSH